MHNQSLMDISIQEYGTLEAMFDMAVTNGISITDELTVGSQIDVPESTSVQKEVLAYYQKNNIHPATGSTIIGETTIPTPPQTGGCSWTLIEW